MTLQQLKSSIRVIEDFPVKGIHFQDVTTLFIDPECIKEITNRLLALYQGKGITKVVGLEARGFVFGAILAERLGAGFVPARKKGKLPAETLSLEYDLEYGTDSIEIHTDAISANDTVLIHDDILATGGTLLAAFELTKKFGPKFIYANTLIDLTACKRVKNFPKELNFTSLIQIDTP